MDQSALEPTLRFAAPSRAFSRSPSHSPNRRQHSSDLDPLLSQLSPTATLEALESTQAVGSIKNTGNSVLRDSVEGATTSERALGIRAALAAKKSREWCQELMEWPWPTLAGQNNGFEAPPGYDRSRNARHYWPDDRLTELGLDTHRFVKQENARDDVYWGSLPEKILQEYENRIEIIADHMERLGLEELKDHVRDVHLAIGSSRSSLQSTGHHLYRGYAGNYNHLDDFAAVITATIMQALPTITQLDILLDTWAVRLSVLRQVPGFLACLEESQMALKSGSNAVYTTRTALGELESSVSREAFASMRDMLESRISELGRRLDSMLDTLEGREDILPEQWIDSMETIEDQFGTWVVETERQILENELNIKQSYKSIGAISQNTMNAREDMPSSLKGLPTLYGYEPTSEQQVREADGKPEAETGTAGDRSVYNLLSGLLGHTEADSDSDDSSSQVPDTQRTNDRLPSDEPRKVHRAELMNPPIVSPERLTDPRTLPVNTELEILDTLEAEILEQKHGPAARPGPLVFHKTHSRAISNVSSEISPDTSYAGSATSEYFSNMSSPEIRDASRAEYFSGPVEVTTPSYVSKDPTSPSLSVSRHSSQRTERGEHKATESIFPSSYISPPAQRSRASTLKQELGVNDIASFKDGFFPSLGQPGPTSRARSASLEIVDGARDSPTRSNTYVGGGGTYASTSPGLWRSNTEDIGPGRPLTSALLRLQDDESRKMAQEKSTPAFQLEDKSRSSLQSQSSKDTSGPASSFDSAPPIPLKSKHRYEVFSDLGPGPTPVKIRQKARGEPTNTSNMTPISSPVLSSKTTFKTSDDQLEARISSILTNIPAHIRLTSGPEADAPEVLRSEGMQDLQTPLKESPARRLSRSQTSAPSPITLAPAHPKSSKMRSQGDSEIKLYHLHQVGKAAPIKLYIRLVGENGERVMVRIGGGWADLGEYLKEYATHHGRRSISGGKFEIQGLQQSQSSSPTTISTGHSSARKPPSSRPESPVMPTLMTRRLSELASSSTGAPVTPENPAHVYQDSAPRSRDSSPTSIRPSSRHSWTEDDSPLGLAGPKTKKLDISPRKQAWVDGMVDQVRNFSAEKKKGMDGDFGDLGNVGGTKRVFLKSRKEG